MDSEMWARIASIKEAMIKSVESGRPYWMQVPGKGVYTIGCRELGIPDICIMHGGMCYGQTLNHVLDNWLVDQRMGVHVLPEDDVFNEMRYRVIKIQTPLPWKHFAFNRDLYPNDHFVQIYLSSEVNGALPGEPDYEFDPEAPDWRFDDNVTWFYDIIEPKRPSK